MKLLKNTHLKCFENKNNNISTELRVPTPTDHLNKKFEFNFNDSALWIITYRKIEFFIRNPIVLNYNSINFDKTIRKRGHNGLGAGGLLPPSSKFFLTRH